MNNEYEQLKLREKFEEEIVEEVTKDFERRRKERLSLERQWELNLNFLSGNQYCDVDGRGELYEEEKAYFWQSRGVFNHIATIIESRLAKFSKINPVLSVRPQTEQDKSAIEAEISEKIIKSVTESCRLHETVGTVTAWSESCGTAFYKVIWNNNGGEKIGETEDGKVYEGNVSVVPVMPFEIFPDSLYVQELESQPSIIHAKAVSVDRVQADYGVTLKGETVNVFGLSPVKRKLGETAADRKSNSVVVIERYELPTAEYPDGRLITVAGGKLLYYGTLPYLNGENGARTYPFIKQEAVKSVGCFFGKSIIERLIPVQRAYNAVKNRKHEFINRLTAGVMTVEDGSVDVDDLSIDGLSPGKILVYRQGSKAPEIMSEPTIPTEFTDEENKLLDEFVIISGTSDLNSSSENAGATSGTALAILIEQDNERLSVNAEVIRNCYVKIAKQILRLFSQHVKTVRAIKDKNALGKTQLIYAQIPEIPSDDVFIESENELGQTASQRKEAVMKLYESGLLSDKDGKVSDYVKERVLELLGYKDLDGRKGVSKLHEEKAQTENAKLLKGKVSVDVIDDDKIHEFEHTRYILSEYQTLTEAEKENLYAHVAEHRERINKQQ